MESEEVIAETVVAPAEPIKADVDVLEFVNLALVQNGCDAVSAPKSLTSQLGALLTDRNKVHLKAID